MLDLQTHVEVVLNKWWVQPSDIPWEEGILRWAGQRGNKFEALGWQQAAQCNQLRVDHTSGAAPARRYANACK